MTAPGLRFGVLAAVSTRRAKFAPEFSGAGGFVESCAEECARETAELTEALTALAADDAGEVDAEQLPG